VPIASSSLAIMEASCCSSAAKVLVSVRIQASRQSGVPIPVFFHLRGAQSHCYVLRSWYRTSSNFIVNLVLATDNYWLAVPREKPDDRFVVPKGSRGLIGERGHLLRPNKR